MNKLVDEYEQRNVYEQDLYNQGYQLIAGIDEVGRGPLAGPVTVGFVILDPNKPIYGLKDSKKLSSKKIAELSKIIKTQAISAITVSVMPQTIDKIGIKNAVHLGMRKALYKSGIKPDYILIDYEQVTFQRIPSMGIIHGDDLSNSIAAASIIAKHARDEYMIKLSVKYKQYGFDKNVGYGTKIHIQALHDFGPIEKVHRFSFKPIRKD